MLRNKKINKKNDSSYRNSIWIKYDGTWNSSRLCVAYGRRKKIKNMSRISPKLIDVERNRIDSDMKQPKISNTKEYHNKQTKSLDNGKEGTGLIRMSVYSEGGRFPTQLFCNIKNDRFKYVKYIT